MLTPTTKGRHKRLVGVWWGSVIQGLDWLPSPRLLNRIAPGFEKSIHIKLQHDLPLSAGKYVVAIHKDSLGPKRLSGRRSEIAGTMQPNFANRCSLSFKDWICVQPKGWPHQQN